MFKSALSAISSTVISAAKSTAAAYKPSSVMREGGAFERIAQQGIANLAYRSPIVADMASTMLQNFQLELGKKERINAYVKSNSADTFRSTVSKNLGGNTSSKKIDAEMEKILDKMSKSIEKDGIEKARESKLFTEYEQYFTEFKKANAPQQEPVASTGSNTNSESPIDGSLHRIESNTLRTVNVLEEIATRHSLTGGNSVGGTNTGSASFIDPMTGMPSMRAAVGSIGGSFLAKIFDDDTISKFANKSKKFFGIEDAVDEPKAKSQKQKDTAKPNKFNGTKDVSDILGDLSLDLNKTKDGSPIFDEKKSYSSAPTTENTSEAAKEIANVTNNQTDSLLKVQEEILIEMRELNKTTETNAKKDETVTVKSKVAEGIKSRLPGTGDATKGISHKLGTVVGRGLKSVKSGVSKLIETGGKAASYIPEVATKATSVVSTAVEAGKDALMARAALPALGAALPVLGIGAAAAGGYMLGKHVINPLIDKGISTITGGKSQSLGDWISNTWKSDAEKKLDVSDASYSAKYNKEPQSIQPIKSTITKELGVLTDAKDKQTESINSGTTPIIVNNTTNSTPQPSNSVSSPTNSAVRNSDSTFERVQMQDFWPRTP
jgi:hypothetical protein